MPRVPSVWWSPNHWKPKRSEDVFKTVSLHFVEKYSSNHGWAFPVCSVGSHWPGPPLGRQTQLQCQLDSDACHAGYARRVGVVWDSGQCLEGRRKVVDSNCRQPWELEYISMGWHSLVFRGPNFVQPAHILFD